jgi:hypothetical protein
MKSGVTFHWASPLGFRGFSFQKPRFSYRDSVSARKEHHAFCCKDPVNERNKFKPIASTWASALRSSGNHSGS